MQIEPHKFVLTSRGLANIYAYPFEKDFTFKVGGHNYALPKILAFFISPKIAQASIADPFINEFEINADDSYYQFNLIMRLLSGDSINITESNAHYLLDVGNQLQNQDLIDLILSFISTPLTVQNASFRLQQKISFHGDTSSEINFIASHFSEMDEENLKQMDTDTLYLILQSPDLSISSESSLFQFIIKLIAERGNSAKRLLESIFYESLLDSDIEQLWTIISHNEITRPMWASLERRLAHQSLSSEILTKRYSQKIIRLFFKSDPFDGICNYLTQKAGGNIHEKGVIRLSASGTSNNSFERVLNYQWNGYWASNNSPNSYLRFDFKDYTVQLNGYSLRARDEPQGGGHPKSWVIEGSNDGKTWTTLNSQQNSDAINGRRQVHTFKLPNLTLPYRYLQMRLTDRNHRGDNFFNITNIEFFGELIAKPE